MENQTLINIGLILAMIAGFTIVVVLDDEGKELEPTHYCESRELKMYCAKVTEFYCYPSLETRLGSKKCNEGWREIPQEIQQIKQHPTKRDIHCTSKGCK